MTGEADPVIAMSSAALTPQIESTPWWKKKRFTIPAAVVAGLLVIGILSPDTDSTQGLDAVPSGTPRDQPVVTPETGISNASKSASPAGLTDQQYASQITPLLGELAANLHSEALLLTDPRPTSSVWRSQINAAADRTILSARAVRDLEAPSTEKWAPMKATLRRSMDAQLEAQSLLKIGVESGAASTIVAASAKMEESNRLAVLATSQIPK